MSRIAPRIHTDPAQIARLEALLPQLDGETQVELILHDGRRSRHGGREANCAAIPQRRG